MRSKVDTVNLCKDCEHFSRNHDTGILDCLKKLCLRTVAKEDPVTGANLYQIAARERSEKGKCGPLGLNFKTIE